ncbi:MAG: hypothetical protein P1Q69_20270 [Candidatus Thorarchaeota archaeon]|nr:hypothetical protein [Candidatus Thorarchaeota archaeon]
MNEEHHIQTDLESHLTGKTLRVYWWLLRHPGPHSARAVQRALSLSSPSLSVYHIDKMKSLGLVETTTTGEHLIAKETRVGVLEFFIGRGRFHFPRYVFYSLFYTIVLVMLPFVLPFYPSPLFILCYVILFFGSTTSWRETIRMWKQAPF